MTFIIPQEELTNEGPFSLGPIRPLNSLEIVYTEMVLQMELKKALEAAVVEEVGEPGPSAAAMGSRSASANLVALPDALVQAPAVAPTKGQFVPAAAQPGKFHA